MTSPRNPGARIDDRRDTVASGPLVLVVESDLESNRSVCDQLAPDYRVVAAFEADEGRARAAELLPDVIVMGVVPGGTELVRELRSHDALGTTPILLLTSEADVERRVRLLREGAQDYIVRPFAVEELRARIERLLDVKHASQSAARLAALVEHAPDAIIVADPDGRFVEVNPEGCQMLGYERDEILGKNILDLVPPEDAERLARAKQQLLAGLQVGEWRLRRKDGALLPVEVSATILRDGRWQGFVRDVSGRKRLEAELRHAHAMAAGIISISADAMISIDGEQRITIFNDGAEQIFGYSRAEAIGAPLDILIPERFRTSHRLHVERFAAGAEVARRMGERGKPIFGLRKSGEEFPADAAISRLQIDGSQVLSVAVRDITYQKRIENQQRFLAEAGGVLASTLDYESTLVNMARLVVRNLADFCIVDLVDSDRDVRRLRVVSRDPAHAWVCELLERLPIDRTRPHLALAALEPMQPTLIEHVTPDALEAIALAQGEGYVRALQAMNPSSLITTPLVAHETLLGVITLISSTPTRAYGPADVALIEELARRAALSIASGRLYRAARRATQERDDVLGIVAHDLRSPLSAIGMQAEVFRRVGDGSVQQPAERIVRSVDRMGRMIDDLFDVTRIEAGQLAIEPAVVSANPILSETVNAQRPLADAADLELLVDPALDQLPEVWADRDRVLQIFENLIGNAIKFTPSGGRITIGAEPDDGNLVFQVADTGPGIPPEDQPHLFDRFWQARRAERRGAGLGLPIVKGLVDAHGGRVWVESGPERGTTFFFTLPIA
jgi:PAS domain S-box-containing protein